MVGRTRNVWIFRALFVLMLAVFAMGGSVLRADDAKTGNMNCDGQPVTDHQFQQQAGDVLEPSHLEIVRPFSGSGTLTVSICNAQLHVRTRPDAKELKLSVVVDGKSADKPAVDYIHILQIAPDHGVIHLNFPGDSHAVVTLTAPMSKGLESEFNLGKGDLDFDAIGSAGGRQINVGYGHAKLLVEGDKSYSGMEVNIGMGSLHDHRPGGRDGHFVVSRNYSGSGEGSLEINVGMGSLDIAQE
jgi:hypothetical protein